MSATSSGHSASVNSTIVGGVEVSASFMNEEIRDLVVSSGLRHGWRPPSTGFFPAAGRAATPQMLQLPLRSGSGGGSGSARIQMKEEKPCFDGKGIRFEIGVSHTSLWLSAVDIPTASRPTHKYCFLRYRFFDQGEFQESSVFFPKQRTGGCDLGWGLQPHQSNWSHPIPTSKIYLYCWANMPQYAWGEHGDLLYLYMRTCMLSLLSTFIIIIAAVVTSPKAITCSREGIATYQLNHRARLHLTGSAQLQW